MCDALLKRVSLLMHTLYVYLYTLTHCMYALTHCTLYVYTICSSYPPTSTSATRSPSTQLPAHLHSEKLYLHTVRATRSLTH